MDRLFESINDQPDEVPTVLKGKIPDWLTGYLFRIGPGKWDLDEGFCLNHWFDGCAILYRYAIKDGKVTFKSRFLDTDVYRKMCTVKRPVLTEFGTRSYSDPCKSIFTRFMSYLIPQEMTDNVVVNVFPVSDELYCVTETSNMWRVDPESLQALNKVDLSKIISVSLASAHPCWDEHGSFYNLGASFTSGLKYHIIKVPPGDAKLRTSNEGAKGFDEASILSTIPSSWKTCYSYYHSFCLGVNYIVLVEQPLLVNIVKLAAAKVMGYSLSDALEWAPQEKTRFVVVDKFTGEVLSRKYVAEPFFFFHSIHTYECDNNIILDLIAYKDASIVKEQSMKNLKAGHSDSLSTSHLRRYVLPLHKSGPEGKNLVKLPNVTATAVKQKNGDIFLTPQFIGGSGYELPTINTNYHGKPYRYVYGSGMFADGPFRNAVCKIDLQTEEAKVWKDTKYMFPGEAIFVPTPDAKGEDDGVLLTAVVDIRPNEPDFFLLLDASTMKELARAEIKPETRLGLAFHSSFTNPF